MHSLKNEFRKVCAVLYPGAELMVWEPLYGGSINQSFRYGFLYRGAVQKGVVKINRRAEYPDMFALEARGLGLLKEAGARVPRVLAQENTDKWSFLLLEDCGGDESRPEGWRDLAVSLVRLHQESSAEWGLAYDNYIGSLKQINKPKRSWWEFYTQVRLRKLLQQLPSHRAELWQKLFALDDPYPEEKPALLHGDLWRGNVVVQDKAWMIDPAVYYGHREMDLAMAKLFGGFPEEFFSEYHRLYPLAEGWQGRIAIGQLYPLLVHGVLFGSGYLQEAEGMLQTWVQQYGEKGI
jgi:fructosamine-3-kinase